MIQVKEKKKMKTKGKVFKYGNNIDTDVIIPARYLNTSHPAELAKHCMEDIDNTFVSRIMPGDILVAGQNFGSGSSREHAPIALKACGIGCIIANNFARIFFRNAINIGLPILECPEAAQDIEDGDQVEVDFNSGKIHNLTKERFYQAQPFPDFIQSIIREGGLIPYITNLNIHKKRRKISNQRNRR